MLYYLLYSNMPIAQHYYVQPTVQWNNPASYVYPSSALQNYNRKEQKK